jgi:hypothetical protein
VKKNRLKPGLRTLKAPFEALFCYGELVKLSKMLSWERFLTATFGLSVARTALGWLLGDAIFNLT